MQVSPVTRRLLRRSLMLQAAGVALAAGGAAYYFTHPQRVAAQLPEELQATSQSVTLTGSDGALLHATWIPGRGRDGRPFERTIAHHHGFNSCGGVLLARRAMFERAPVALRWPEQRDSLCAWPVVFEGLKRGYNFLLLDARAHGKSGGAWDTTGELAISDAARWASWLRNEHTQLWVGLWGNSFGAAVGLGLAVRPSGGGYDAMVLDSPVVMAEGVYSGVCARRSTG
jgi:pimeloyl-ACP methyl ester carboxylesterase